MTNNLFVGGFPYETTSEELTALFRTCGAVTSVKVLMEKETGRPRGLAFV
jgi:RNA recognition motif-containing protein